MSERGVVPNRTSTLLHTRAWPRQTILPAWQEWLTDIHMPALMQSGLLSECICYKTVSDGLPTAFHRPGVYMVNYVASDLRHLRAWLDHPTLAEALRDGERWLDGFNELDGEQFTGTVYEELTCLSSGDTASNVSAPVLVERFDVPSEAESVFDNWLLEGHLPSLAASPEINTVTVFKSIRDGIAISYYRSPGNRMIVSTFSADTNVTNSMQGRALLEVIGLAMDWDLRLPYTSREIYDYVEHWSAGTQQ